MKNILITGITGLLGSTMARVLSDDDVNIVGVARQHRDNKRMKYCIGNVKNISMAYGSVGDYDFIDRVINEEEIDTIFHFGAQAIVGKAELSPRGTFKSNVEGTLNILESAKNNKVKAIATISSDKMYGHAPCPYKEDGVVQPKEVYSTSKTCSDFITQCYGKNFNIPCVVFRSCNFFGPGDFNFTRIVPNTIIRSLKGENPFIWDGVSKYVREFIYSEDAVSQIIQIVNKLYSDTSLYGEAFNIGTGVKYTVEDFINKVAYIANPNVSVDIKKKYFDFNEIKEQWLDLTKLENTIGKFSTMTEKDIDGCLYKTVEFYKEYFNL